MFQKNSDTMIMNTLPEPENGVGDKETLKALNAQREATTPLKSVWVSASAGSGKTKVLTDRVLRLLLEGNNPQRILCITFTKAAAVEMSNRLHNILSEWAIFTATQLQKSLHLLLGRLPNETEIKRAKELFAITLESVDFPRIQTIHSFCQSILKRFPLEAKISPHFRVIEESEASFYLKKAHHLVLESSGQPVQESIDYLATFMSEQALSALVDDLIQERHHLTCFLQLHSDVEKGIAHILKNLEIQNLKKDEEITQDSLTQIPETLFLQDLPYLQEGNKTDIQSYDFFTKWFSLTIEDKSDIYFEYINFFLTHDGFIRQRLLSQKLTQQYPKFADALMIEAERILRIEEKRKTHLIARNTAALLRYACETFETYQTLKHHDHILDYSDLITKMNLLLLEQNISAWVLYKLDGGLDHILIDEAQDTNEEQWQIIKSLGEEFFASSQVQNRTFFVVGDKKQSIYSFQGANPQTFEDMYDYFSNFAKEGKKPWQKINLDISFRSTPEILKTVDSTFSQNDSIKGVSLEPIHHIPFRKTSKGIVEIWPCIEKEEEDISPAWDLQTSSDTSLSSQTLLAKLMAETIQTWIQNKRILPTTQKPIRPNDIMILVRRRSAFVDDLIRYLKDFKIPVSGVDRMVLLEQLPIKDLLAILAFILLPEDNLNLATILKTPLFNITEQELFSLTYSHNKYPLWHELKKQSRYNLKLKKIVEILEDLLHQGQLLTPFSLLSYILGPLQGRQLWQQRLGPEVLDSLEELLNLSLSYEQNFIPTLQGFIDWVMQENLEIKRDLEKSDNVRILTVHGSKGLQAPIVFLPDTTQIPTHSPSLLWSPDKKSLFWVANVEQHIPLTATLKQTFQQTQQEEYYRLLYVAMTRAEDQLYVCGWKGQKNIPETCWYNLVYKGLTKIPETIDFDVQSLKNSTETGSGFRLTFEKDISFHKNQPTDQPISSNNESLPEWISRPFIQEKPSVIITPSQVIEDSFQHSSTAAYRGILIHRLLEILPPLSPKTRREKGLSFLSSYKLLPKDAENIMSSITKVLDDFSYLFDENSHTEVAISGKLQHHKISGQIDRLVFMDEKIILIDYKTTEHVPETLDQIPSRYLRQLSLYKSLLESLYPSFTIETALLWTHLPRLDFIPENFLKLYDPLIDSLAIRA